MQNANRQSRDGHFFKNYFLTKTELGSMIGGMNSEILHEKNVAMEALDYLDNNISIDSNENDDNYMQSLRSIVSSSVDTSSYLFTIVSDEIA